MFKIRAIFDNLAHSTYVYTFRPAATSSKIECSIGWDFVPDFSVFYEEKP
jgi:hypothetical protein